MFVEPPIERPPPVIDLTQDERSVEENVEVTSTVETSETSSGQNNYRNVSSSIKPEKVSDVIQSSFVSQSTGNAGEQAELQSNTPVDSSTQALPENANEACHPIFGQTTVIARNKIESKAKRYLQELQDSETDEQTENLKRLTELEESLHKNDKVQPDSIHCIVQIPGTRLLRMFSVKVECFVYSFQNVGSSMIYEQSICVKLILQ